MSWIPLCLGAYLLGAVPFSVLIVRWRRHLDVRTVGSGNPGATNVLRVAGRGPALAVLALDLGKGLAPVLAARALGAPAAVEGLAAAAAVLGHVFPVYLGFRGGKGVASAAGAFAAISPAALGVTALLFAAIVAWTRYVSVASIAAAAAYPLALYGLGAAGVARPPDGGLAAAVGFVSLLVIWKHRPNLRRLRRGEELRLGAGRSG